MSKFTYRFQLDQTAFPLLIGSALLLLSYSIILFATDNNGALVSSALALKLGLILSARCGQLYLCKLNCRIVVGDGQISWFDWKGQERILTNANAATIVRIEHSFKLRIDTDRGTIRGAELYEEFSKLTRMDQGGPAVMIPLRYKKRKVFPYRSRFDRIISFILAGALSVAYGVAIILSLGGKEFKDSQGTFSPLMAWLIGTELIFLGLYWISQGAYSLSSVINRRIEIDDDEVLLFDWQGRLKLRADLATAYFPFMDSGRLRVIKTRAGDIPNLNDYRNYKLLADHIKPYAVASALGIVVPSTSDEKHLRQSS